MQSKPQFFIALLTLMLIGVWGLLQIKQQNSDAENTQLIEQNAEKAHTSKTILKVQNDTQRDPTNSGNDDSAQSSFDSILQLINNGQARSAAQTINERYSSLSAAELDSLKSALLTLAFRANTKDSIQTKNILLATSTAFDDLVIWTYLGDAAAADNDWDIAFKAYFRASELENDPSSLVVLLDKLIVSSGHLRSDLEGNGDRLSVKNLYQRLSDLHPNFQRFQYELAISNLKLGEIDNAKQLLESLVYDPELGEVSKQTLARINSAPEPKPSDVAKQEPQRNLHSSDIVVPLIAAGSSFIVSSTIERKPARLLLDTGASITSLSSQLVERLALEPTGQSIRLSTANGLTNSRIYRVKQLRLGGLVLRDMLVAEINLSNNRNFQGLLGTDALNQLKPQYSYLIDNREKALIFRKR